MKRKTAVRCVLATSLWLCSSSTLLTPRTAIANANNYTLNLHVPEHLVACNSPSWFESRFDHLRQGLQFKSQMNIDVSVTEDGAAGFILNVTITSSDPSMKLAPIRRAYAAPTECSKVVSDAAEIAAALLSAKSPQPLEIPRSFDHRFQLHVPTSLEACFDPNYLAKWFELSRGSRRFLAPWPKTIEITLGGNLDKQVTVDVVVRGSTGRPIRDANNMALDDIRFFFNGPTECAKVLASTAQYLVPLLWPLPSSPSVGIQNPTTFPVPAPHSPHLDSLAAGPIFQAYLVPNVIGMGFQATYMRLKPPNWAFRADMRISTHLPFRSDKGFTKGELTYLATGSAAACYIYGHLHSCTFVSLGAAQLVLDNVPDSKASTLPTAHLGALMALETKPLYGISLRAEGGFYVSLFAQGAKVTGAETKERVIITPKLFGLTTGVSLVSHF